MLEKTFRETCREFLNWMLLMGQVNRVIQWKFPGTFDEIKLSHFLSQNLLTIQCKN
jgi:hypothetical protein